MEISLHIVSLLRQFLIAFFNYYRKFCILLYACQ